MIRLDLHTHSTASDGQYTPLEMVQKANDEKLSYYALTDHDTIDGIAMAKEEAYRLGVNFIPGIEISTHEGEEVHIVGLFIDETAPSLVSACEEYKNSRLGRGERIIDFLNSKGIPISSEDLPKNKLGSLGRPFFAEYLVKHGHVITNKEAFLRYLNTAEFHKATDRIKPTPEEAIRLIHSAGGKAILAHPGLLKMGHEWQRTYIKKLAEAGLDGIEVYYFTHKDSQKRFYHELAREYHLLTSCGSDFHGEKVKPSVPFGMRLEKEAFEDFIIPNIDVVP